MCLLPFASLALDASYPLFSLFKNNLKLLTQIVLLTFYKSLILNAARALEFILSFLLNSWKWILQAWNSLCYRFFFYTYFNNLLRMKMKLQHHLKSFQVILLDYNQICTYYLSSSNVYESFSYSFWMKVIKKLENLVNSLSYKTLYTFFFPFIY